MGLVNRMAIFYRCFYSYGHLGSQIFALKSSFQHVYCIGTEYCRVVSRRIIETNRYGIFTRDMEAIHIFHIPRLFRPVEV